MHTHRSTDPGRSARSWDHFLDGATVWLLATEDWFATYFRELHVSPKRPSRLPNRPQTFVVRYSILYDEALDAFRMGQCHAKSHRAAVILHVERVMREPKRLGKAIDDLGEMIERIREPLRVRPVAVSETRVVRCDKVAVVRKSSEERLEHSR